MDGERGSPTSDETAGSSNNNTNTKMSTQMRSIKKERGSSMGSYRDTYREKPATPNSPSGTTVTTVYDHMLSPPSPQQEEEEKDDRLRNDLLDEICNDMGIDDSMDLDLDDFCYSGAQAQQKGSGAIQQRFGQIVTPGKQAEGDASRRTSVTTASSSGYATSDSLCAIAKLTQSISTEGQPQQPGSEVEGRQRESPESAVKQEPDVEPEASGVNDTDHGKAAAASHKLALQKQLSESAVPDRKRSAAATSDSSGQDAAAVSQRTPAQPMIDYSYQDDYSMEDMTAPDTMINFSEMPQQPNYYQCPQAAHDNLSIGFNMSLQQQQQHAQPGYPGHPPTSQPFGHSAFGSMPQQSHADMGRSSPRLGAAQNPFQNSPAQMHPPPHGSPAAQAFQSCSQQPGTPSGPSTLQPNHSQGFHRSESFPGAHPSFHGSAGTPTHHQQQHGQSVAQSTPHTPASQKAGGSSQAHSAPSTSGSTPTTPGTPSTPGGGPNFNSSQQGFMQRLVTDKSSAFRSHPLFPLLRDLIIADMNFHEPSFPHSLIRDLPSDFNKLLTNYLSRNPRKRNYQSNQSVESVVMDALKYAHHTLIEKISQKKLLQQQEEAATTSSAVTPRNPAMSVSAGQPSMAHMPMSNVNEYCEKFEDTVRQSMPQAQAAAYGGNRSAMSSQQPSPVSTFRPSRIREPGPMYGGEIGQGGTYGQPLTVDTGCPSPSSSRTANPLVTAPPPTQPTHIYGQSPVAPPHYHQHGVPMAYGRSPQQAGPRNPYMNPHGPPCPPPNYTVSPNNPPLPRHQQMYDMGPPPPAAVGSGVPHGITYGDPSAHPYNDPYCMPSAAHHRLSMGPPDRHLMYMNNINDPNLVKQMMDDSKGMYDSMSDNASVISAHSMQGSVKGGPQGQKPTEGRKHASLPKEAVNIMLNWLREHQDKPYPNDDEKGMLIKQTGLSITQINYWFTNARRRLLPKWRGEDM